MFAFFDSILGFIHTLWDFVLSWASIYAFCIQAIGQAIALPIAIIPYLPAVIGGAFYLVICVMIARFFLGR